MVEELWYEDVMVRRVLLVREAMVTIGPAQDLQDACSDKEADPFLSGLPLTAPDRQPYGNFPFPSALNIRSVNAQLSAAA